GPRQSGRGHGLEGVRLGRGSGEARAGQRAEADLPDHWSRSTRGAEREPEPGVMEPSTLAWRAPVARASVPSTPWWVRKPSSANAEASLAWAGRPSAPLGGHGAECE